MNFLEPDYVHHAGMMTNAHMTVNPYLGMENTWNDKLFVPYLQNMEQMAIETTHLSLENNYECNVGDEQEYGRIGMRKKENKLKKEKIMGKICDQYEVLKEGEECIKELIRTVDGKLDKLRDDVGGEGQGRELKSLATKEIYKSMLEHIGVLEDRDNTNTRAFTSLRREIKWLSQRNDERSRQGLKGDNVNLKNLNVVIRARGVEKPKIRLRTRSRSEGRQNRDNREHKDILQSIGHTNKNTMLHKYIKQRERQMNEVRGL